MPKDFTAPIRERDEDFYIHALTEEESDLCKQIMMFGPEFLRSVRKWNAAKVTAFLGRAEVRKEIERLTRQYEDRDGIQERTQFLAQLRVNSMVPAALSVMARALRGAYRDQEGKVVEAPTPQQVNAAQDILNRANIQGTKYAGNDSVPAIDARSISVAIGNAPDVHQLDSKGREKVTLLLRTALNKTRQFVATKEPKKVKRVDQDSED